MTPNGSDGMLASAPDIPFMAWGSHSHPPWSMAHTTIFPMAARKVYFPYLVRSKAGQNGFNGIRVDAGSKEKRLVGVLCAMVCDGPLDLR